MPKGPRKFYFAFEKSGLTRLGGLSLFQAFCRAFAICHFLLLSVRWPPYDHRDYHPADLFRAHVSRNSMGGQSCWNARTKSYAHRIASR